MLCVQVREERAVAVLLVDLLDASGSFLSRVRDLIGKNPVFLVGTKVRTATMLHVLYVVVSSKSYDEKYAVCFAFSCLAAALPNLLSDIFLVYFGCKVHGI